SDVPQAGDPFMVFDDERKARQIAEKRAENTWKEEHGVSKSVSLDDMFAQFADSEKKQLNVIIKGDTQGSIEALKGALEQIDVEGANVSVIRSSVGTITETDVTLALASQGIIIGFNVRPNAAVRDDAREKGVEIRLYSVIYKAIEDVEMAMKGMLDPEYEEVITGQAEVRDTFKVSKIGTVAGCYVTDGTIQRDSTVRVIRDGVVIYEGDLSSLKRFKDDAKEVRQGFECGITIDKFNDIKVGDIIEASVMKEVER
ncbi:MAG: translation initiation factor IF-2, partial [Bacillota bacterium]